LENEEHIESSLTPWFHYFHPFVYSTYSAANEQF